VNDRASPDDASCDISEPIAATPDTVAAPSWPRRSVWLVATEGMWIRDHRRDAYRPSAFRRGDIEVIVFCP